MIDPAEARPSMEQKEQDLLLLLQGGLGNQLLQLVLAESLAQRLGLRLVGSKALLDSRSRRLRGLTTRSLSPLVQQRLPLRPVPWHRQVLPRLAARLGPPGTVLTDQLLLAAATRGPYLMEQLETVRVIHSHATHPSLFGAEFTPSWGSILAALGPYQRAPAVQVALHVRRTDYLNPHSGFFPLGLPYYRAAITRALAAVPTAPYPTVVHVCSDDPAWCRTHLHDPSWDLQIAGGTPEQDLATMAGAQVLITGNSSLSAIAGHLAQLRDPSALVLTPGRWLLNPDGRFGELRKAEWQVVSP